MSRPSKIYGGAAVRAAKLRAAKRRAEHPDRKRSAADQERVLRYVREALRDQRIYLGYEQAEVAKLTGIGVATIGRIEIGVQPPSLVHLYRLARAYRCNPKGFLP